MMKNLKFTFLLLFASLIWVNDMKAQVIDSDFWGVMPGPTFNPAGKFTALGESGGAPGPIAGCDLYGFRTQYNLNNNISIGMERPLLSPFPQPASPYVFPTIQYNSSNPNARLLFKKENLAANFYCGRSYVGMGPISNNNYVLYVWGEAFATGGWSTNSDLRLKEEVSPITNALDIVEKLEGVTYKYNKDIAPEKNFGDQLEYGFVAQEVQKILPSIIQTDDEGYLGMKYDAIIPIMTEAIKIQQEFIRDQDNIIEDQNEKIDNLEERLAKIERLLNSSQSRMGTSLSTTPTNGASLKQNRPNPFNNKTTVEYTLPETITNATLNIYDLYGKVINSFDINSNSGTIEINAKNMNNGTYIYSLEADGKNLAKEKMTVIK